MVPINISTRHGHLSEAAQDKIREKLDRLPRYNDRISAMTVTVDLEHEEKVRVDLKATAKGGEFAATAEAESLLAAIDALVEKMEHQLRKAKEKEVDRHRHPGETKRSPNDAASPASDDESFES